MVSLIAIRFDYRNRRLKRIHVRLSYPLHNMGIVRPVDSLRRLWPPLETPLPDRRLFI